MDVWVRKRVVFMITVHEAPIIRSFNEDVEDSRLVFTHVGKVLMWLLHLFGLVKVFKLDLWYLFSEIFSSFQ